MPKKFIFVGWKRLSMSRSIIQGKTGFSLASLVAEVCRGQWSREIYREFVLSSKREEQFEFEGDKNWRPWLSFRLAWHSKCCTEQEGTIWRALVSQRSRLIHLARSLTVKQTLINKGIKLPWRKWCVTVYYVTAGAQKLQAAPFTTRSNLNCHWGDPVKTTRSTTTAYHKIQSSNIGYRKVAWSQLAQLERMSITSHLRCMTPIKTK